MEQLRKLSQLCRQHYEKLLLSIALLLLGGAVLYLFSESKNQADIIRKIPVGFEQRKVATVKPIELTNHFMAMKRAESPMAFNFSQPHNLFNPVQWQIPPGGTVAIKKVTGEETGPKSMLISGARPFHLGISYVGPASSGAGENVQVSGYWIGFTNEAVLRHTQTAPRTAKLLLSLNTTNPISPIVLTEVKGPPAAPEAVLGKLRDTGEPVTLSVDKPFEKVVGYETRIQYPNSTNFVANGAWLRVNMPVEIDGQGYKIVDIKPTEVKIVADSNEKPYSITKVAP